MWRGLSRRRGESPAPDPEPWADDDEPSFDPGAYELAVLSEEPMTLAAAIRHISDGRLELAGVVEPFTVGQLLMLGGPGWNTFEIVQVRGTDPTPAQDATSCLVRRGVLRTVGGPHPVGTPVTPIAVERLPMNGG